MATIVSTAGRPTPYITIQELKQSPVYTQLRALVPGQSDADRDAQLGRIIMRASSLINGEVSQNLAATVDVEVGEVTVTSLGELRVHTRCNPIIEVLSLSVGRDYGSLVPVTDLSHLVIEPWRFNLPGGISGSANNLPSVALRPGRKLFAEWSYINGYPTTTLSAPTIVGATTVTVGDATGIKPGRTLLTIEDGKWVEQVTPSAVTGNVLTVPPLSWPHQASTGVTQLPDAIKEATFLLISRLHDTWSLTMNAVTTDGTGARKNVPRPNIMCDAASMLSPYRRMW